MIVNSKCKFCPTCDGHGCIGELPGMGGVFDNANFIENVAAWARHKDIIDANTEACRIRLAPITGSAENIGFEEEEPFYQAIIDSAVVAGLGLSIGDGSPDKKLKYGIAALKKAGKTGAIFCKPYSNSNILERFAWAQEQAEYLGVDIDSYNILTMRKLAHLEKKTAGQLRELKAAIQVPFIIKGVFTPEDVSLVRQVRPDIVVVSNHGGRIETVQGATADFLAQYGRELAQYTGAIWVDGGIRNGRDLLVASALGASEVLIGRPFITALLKYGLLGITQVLQERYQLPVLAGALIG